MSFVTTFLFTFIFKFTPDNVYVLLFFKVRLIQCIKIMMPGAKLLLKQVKLSWYGNQ